MIRAGVNRRLPFSFMRACLLSNRYLFCFILLANFCAAQAAKAVSASDVVGQARQGVKLAAGNRCSEALPVLKTVLGSRELRGDLKRQAGLAGVRCAMLGPAPDTATDFLRMLIREFPRDPEVLYLSVHTYSDLSTRAAQQLAVYAPKSAQARELNAEALEMQGKWNEAEKEYQAVLHENPREPGIHFRMGRLLLSRPNPAPDVARQARKEFEEELKIDPSNAGAEYVLGEIARQEQRWDDAVQHFSRASKLDSGFGDAFLGLGQSLIATKKFSEAVPPLETAAKLEPSNPAAHYNLATAYSRAGRKEEADKEFAIHRQMTQKGEGDQTVAPASPAASNPN